jgi:phage terminase large subunit GpA-like protein
MLSSTAQNIWSQAVATWKPPAKMTLSQWADTFGYLSPESSAAPGRWRTLPYQKEIMDAFTDPAVERITLMKSARVGYTKIINHAIGYHIHQDPCPILCVQPTIEDAQGYSKDEIAPMLRDTEVLNGLVADARSRDSDNTILKKNFSGGTLIMVGANSARGFRRISARIVLFDETDGYPPGGAGAEGDQIMLGIRRSEYFWNRKIVLGSTPTIKGISKIEDSYEQSDQRKYFVPCPLCGHMQVLKWRRITWPAGKPEQAAYECESCENLIAHSKKRWMVENGQWRATKPFNGHAGFHIWAAYSYSPNATWAKLAKEREQIGKDKQKLQTFINTVLGESWEEQGSQPDWAALKARCEQYQFLTVPENGYILTAGVDVQDNRLAVIIRAWGKGEESWLVFWGEIYGDPGQPQVWSDLDELLNRNYEHASGANLQIVSAAIDSGGHHTQAVYNFARTRVPKVFPIKGQSQAGKPVIGRPSKVDVNWKGAVIKSGVQLWPVGSDTAKSAIYARLQQNESGPGTYHWPIGLDDDYFVQLTAEKLITRYSKAGYPKQEWVKTGPRNEALDCEVYAYAAANRIGISRIDFDKFKHVKPNTEAPINHTKPKAKRRVARSNWMSR